MILSFIRPEYIATALIGLAGAWTLNTASETGHENSFETGDLEVQVMGCGLDSRCVVYSFRCVGNAPAEVGNRQDGRRAACWLAAVKPISNISASRLPFD